METYISTLERQSYKSVADREESIDVKTDFQAVSDILPDEIYTEVGSKYKGGAEEGWLENDNLLSASEARNHLQSGGNVGIRLGEWVNGYCYVALDIEEAGTLPLDLHAVVDSHAVLAWDSVHEGRNRLLRIERQEALDLIQSLPDEVANLTQGDGDDIEILTGDRVGSVVIPPSSISHTTCNDNKPCDGKGTDRYVLQSVNRDAPTFTTESVDRLSDLLDIKPEETSGGGTTHTTPITDDVDESDVPSPNEITDSQWSLENEFDENVPHESDTVEDRHEKMFHSDWEARDRFVNAYNGRFAEAGFTGSNVQGKAECTLANYIGFWFGRNKRIIQWYMENLPFETHYQKYPAHRKNLLEWATSVDWVYCEGVSFDMKLTVAARIWIEGRTSVSDIVDKGGMDKEKERHVRRVIPILEAEGVVQRHTDGRERPITNEGIAEGYLLSLEAVCQKYEDYKPAIKRPSPNVSRTEI